MVHDFLSPNVLTAFAVCMAAALFTVLGAFSVVGAKTSNPRLLSLGLAFAGGAMVYISLVEIFGKSHSSFLQMTGDKEAYFLSTLCFFCGVMFLVLLDRLLPNPHCALTPAGIAKDEGLKRMGLMAAIAITAHNVPEGMATFFSTLDNPSVGLSLAVAIAIHNIPEGVSIAIPVFYATGSKKLTVLACVVSAIAEPLGALLGYAILAPFLGPAVYGCVFGMIAGAMVFLALDELIPAAKRYASGHDAVYGMVIGMVTIAASLVLFR